MTTNQPARPAVRSAWFEASLRLVTAALIEAQALNLDRILTHPGRTLDRVLELSLPNSADPVDDALADLTHHVFACLACVGTGGLPHGLPQLPDQIMLAGCLDLIDQLVGSWTRRDLAGLQVDLTQLQTAARTAVLAVAEGLS